MKERHNLHHLRRSYLLSEMSYCRIDAGAFSTPQRDLNNIREF